LIPGFHGVREAVTGGQTRIREIWVAEGKKTLRTGEILQMAKEKNIPVIIKKNEELSRSLPGISHQGIVALVEGFSYCELSRLTDTRPKNQALLIALDHITDEGNMGAIIRTAVFFGANGLIIPKDRSAGITASVVKRSSGAWMHLPIARVVNLGRALDTLNKKGFWIIGTSGEGRESIYNFDWNRDIVLVLGNEQKGLSQSVDKRCHEIVGIPVSGPAESLNVAVASGVILSEVTRQRKAEELE
jgi:23S rRNA (guanosine2251-2'-O)-methyltransferase